MRKEISPEMYNYNKFPGPEFVHFDDLVKSEQATFKLLENYKDAFDVTNFNQRYSDILLKYDFIVGDWGNEQLRLKGFYLDKSDIKKTSRISRVEDYIKEYCNYGCAYFILQNEHPVEVTFEEEKSPRKRRSHKHHKSKENRPKVNQTEQNQFKTKKKKAIPDKSKKPRKNQDNSHFVIRKKEK